ncbi:MAG TPA: hypothetical protein VEC99_03760, partial [Clostridia bacterium]|nr:hypothetical protein [Clostridia bacterium]
MKTDGVLKHFLLAFLLAAICYVVLYQYIEGRRGRKGPWEVAFTNAPPSVPALRISQPSLAISNVQILFVDHPLPSTNASGVFQFSQPQPVPFPVPFG